MGVSRYPRSEIVGDGWMSRARETFTQEKKWEKKKKDWEKKETKTRGSERGCDRAVERPKTLSLPRTVSRFATGILLTGNYCTWISALFLRGLYVFFFAFAYICFIPGRDVAKKSSDAENWLLGMMTSEKQSVRSAWIRVPNRPWQWKKRNRDNC